MKSEQMNVEENNPIITVGRTRDHGPSSSGKTIVVASTLGNVAVPGEELRHTEAGLSVYHYE